MWMLVIHTARFNLKLNFLIGITYQKYMFLNTINYIYGLFQATIRIRKKKLKKLVINASSEHFIHFKTTNYLNIPR